MLVGSRSGHVGGCWRVKRGPRRRRWVHGKALSVAVRGDGSGGDGGGCGGGAWKESSPRRALLLLIWLLRFNLVRKVGL
jgi:hypothetical protein